MGGVQRVSPMNMSLFARCLHTGQLSVFNGKKSLSREDKGAFAIVPFTAADISRSIKIGPNRQQFGCAECSVTDENRSFDGQTVVREAFVSSVAEKMRPRIKIHLEFHCSMSRLENLAARSSPLPFVNKESTGSKSSGAYPQHISWLVDKSKPSGSFRVSPFPMRSDGRPSNPGNTTREGENGTSRCREDDASNVCSANSAGGKARPAKRGDETGRMGCWREENWSAARWRRRRRRRVRTGGSSHVF
jgi:hypothetical protein